MMAFVPGPGLLTVERSSRTAPVRCSVAPINRRQVLAALAMAAATLTSGKSARAAGGVGLERAVSKFFFPKEGFNAPDAVVPGQVTVDKSVLGSDAGKAAISKLKEYQSDLQGLYSEFKSNPQAEIKDKVSKMISISDLRDALNTVDEAFDEETQRETDKVVRGIIQDIGELETAAVLKKGTERTQKKIERTTDWFEKLVDDFSRLLSFYA